MDWDNIRFFVVVARVGRISLAARHLRVDHGTVSRRIAMLEKGLGVKLFDRLTTGCVLTPAGERLFATAEEIELKLLHAQDDITRTDALLTGTVRIAAPDVFATVFLCTCLGELKALHPSLTVQLVPISRKLSLSKREADIAITIKCPTEGALSVRKLIDYSLHFYAAKPYLDKYGRPKTQAELTRHQHVTYVYDLLFADQLNFVSDLYGPDYRRLECASAIAQFAAVRSGAGIGIVHDYVAYGDKQLEMVLPGMVFERSYWVITHLDTRSLGSVRAVSDFISQRIGASRGMFHPDRAAG